MLGTRKIASAHTAQRSSFKFSRARSSIPVRRILAHSHSRSRSLSPAPAPPSYTAARRSHRRRAALAIRSRGAPCDRRMAAGGSRRARAPFEHNNNTEKITTIKTHFNIIYVCMYIFFIFFSYASSSLPLFFFFMPLHSRTLLLGSVLFP